MRFDVSVDQFNKQQKGLAESNEEPSVAINEDFINCAEALKVSIPKLLAYYSAKQSSDSDEIIFRGKTVPYRLNGIAAWKLSYTGDDWNRTYIYLLKNGCLALIENIRDHEYFIDEREGPWKGELRMRCLSSVYVLEDFFDPRKDVI